MSLHLRNSCIHSWPSSSVSSSRNLVIFNTCNTFNLVRTVLRVIFNTLSCRVNKKNEEMKFIKSSTISEINYCELWKNRNNNDIRHLGSRVSVEDAVSKEVNAKIIKIRDVFINLSRVRRSVLQQEIK